MADWTAKLEATLLERVAAGDTYAAILRMPAFYGFTRNSLIGKARRLGATKPEKPAALTKAEKKAERERAEAARKSARALIENEAYLQHAKDQVAKAVTTPTPGFGFKNNVRLAKEDEIAAAVLRVFDEAKAEPVVPDTAIGFDDLKPGRSQCRMALWKTYTRPGLAEMRFCGKPTIPLRSWCASCNLIVFPTYKGP